MYFIAFFISLDYFLCLPLFFCHLLKTVSYWCLGSSHRETTDVWECGRYVWGIQASCRDPWVMLSQQQSLQWNHQGPCPLKTSDNVISYIPPNLIPPPCHGTFSLVILILQGRKDSLWQCPTQLRKSSKHSSALLFSHGRNSWECHSPKLCYLGGKDGTGKFKLFLLFTPVHSKFFFLYWSARNSLLEMGFLVHGWLPLSVFFRYSWTMAERDLNQFMGFCKNHKW